jgi:hypothetical protein
MDAIANASAAAQPGGWLAASQTKWWLGRRAAAPLDRFRVVIGLALVAHFADLLRNTAPLLVGSGLYDPAFVDQASVTRSSPLAAGLSLPELDAVFAFGMVLAVCVAIGAGARVCAAMLYVISLATYWAVGPVADLGDQLACVAPLFLVLLPASPTLRPRGLGPRRRTGPPARLPGMSTTALLLLVMFVYFHGALIDPAAPDGVRRVATVLRFLPIAFLLPVPGLAALGVGVQLAAHAYLAIETQAVFPHLVLAATGLLFWGEVDQGATEWVADAGCVLSVGYVALFVAAAVLPLGALGAAGARTLRLAADLGAVSKRAVSGARPAGLLAVVTLDRNATNRRPLGARLGRAFGEAWGGDKASPIDLSLATAAARRFCASDEYWGRAGSIVWSAADGDHTIVEFECGMAGSLSAIR